jgi:Fe2+ transport system protein FeoA
MRMPLSVAQIGRRMKIVSIDSGWELHGRLIGLGLMPGVLIEVIRNSANGPLVLSVKGSRVMLGRGVAHKIIVAQAE